MQKKFLNTAAVAAILALTGCATSGGGSGPAAEAMLKPTAGNSASGTVSFREEGGKVRVSGSIAGLTPGQHGFHVHDKGDCSAPDATSAGGHFNPTAKHHGHPEHAERHAGDLPQLMADASGNASINALVDGITIGAGAANIVGRGLIVHAAPDDFKTQPTGNSGARVACAVIVAK